MTTFRGILSKDLGTKALSLILAMAVYIHVFSGQEREMTYRVPLEIAPLPAGMTISSEIPPDVRVRVRGSGKELLKLQARRLEAAIAIESPRPGGLQRPILGSDFRVPRGIKVASIEALDPRTLNITIEKVMARKAPVAVRLASEQGKDRALRSRPSARPASVMVSGPMTKVMGIDSVETEPVSISTRGGDREIAIATPAGLTVDPAQVTVALDTEARHERRFDRVDVQLRLPLGDRILWIQPPEASVVVSGAASVIDGIDPSGVRIVGDIARTNPGLHRVSLHATIPGLPRTIPVRVRCDPESASVRLQ